MTIASPRAVQKVVTASVHGCFKCGNGTNNGDGVVYLGHHWCMSCAREEAKLRSLPARKPAASSSAVAGDPEKAAPLALAARLKAVTDGMAAVRPSGLPMTSAVAGAVLGGGLLLAGLVALGWTGGEGAVGPTLTLAGAIVLAGVVRR